jgi:hypothetical protein
MKMMNNSGITLPFGDCILMAGYYAPNGRSYYGATYRFTTADHSVEGEIELTAIS